MASYQRIDLALDTQPYSGGLTTCEALWMGVPVVTCPGQGFASRHSTSHLTNAGLGQFVAADIEGYLELAVDWASRLDELGQLRGQIRQRCVNRRSATALASPAIGYICCGRRGKRRFAKSRTTCRRRSAARNCDKTSIGR